eukprot:Gb_22840 [translate_table: standard]
MTPHREWFCEYESYDGGDVFLGDDYSYKIIGHGRVKVRFRDGRVKTLPGGLHIPRAMVLARGFRTGTLYKLEASTVSDGYNSSVVGEDSSETKTNPSSPIEDNAVASENGPYWRERSPSYEE